MSEYTAAISLLTDQSDGSSAVVVTCGWDFGKHIDEPGLVIHPKGEPVNRMSTSPVGTHDPAQRQLLLNIGGEDHWTRIDFGVFDEMLWMLAEVNAGRDHDIELQAHPGNQLHFIVPNLPGATRLHEQLIERIEGVFYMLEHLGYFDDITFEHNF